MTGSSDGVIKIFRNYESEKKVELVTAFRALTDLVPSTKNAGLVLDWQQGQGKLLVAGDVKIIRVWNAATEICTSVLPHHHPKSHPLTKPPGHPRSLRLLHHIPNIRSSRRSCLLRRIRRRRYPHLRHAETAPNGYGQNVAQA